MLTLPFMQRAFLGGILVALLGSYYGVFVVQRRMSFLGVGLSHAAFGGVAMGLWLGVQPLWTAFPFTIAVALVITWIRLRTRLSGDTAVGVFFALSVALGVVFLSLRKAYTADVYTYLFGSILAIQAVDLLIMTGLVVLAAGTLTLWPSWAYATFDRELARVDGRSVERDDYLLAVLLAVTVVAAVKLVGILLVSAFLVLPPATARLGVRTFRGLTLYAPGLGVVTVIGGLIGSYWLDVPSGASIVLLQGLVFLIAVAVTRTGSAR